MKFTSQIEDQTGTVKLEGRFTFETHPAFKACTQSLLDTGKIRRVVLDMEGVSYMDASSLGMILLLRETTETRNLGLALALGPAAAGDRPIREDLRDPALNHA